MSFASKSNPWITHVIYDETYQQEPTRAMVEIILRSGERNTGLGESFDWSECGPHTIVHYRTAIEGEK